MGFLQRGSEGGQDGAGGDENGRESSRAGRAEEELGARLWGSQKAPYP